ncbi:nuclear transport factor 2 family protein [Leptothoe sp. ISB3NOV94-8A]
MMSGCVKTVIEQRNAEMMEAFARQDISVLKAMYASDAVLVFSNVPKLTGQAAIGKTFNRMFEDGLKKLTLSTESFHDFGDYALEFGAYSLEIDNSVVTDTGNYQVLWQKVTGTWLMVQDMVSRSQPSL